jgi:hypothetical protein
LEKAPWAKRVHGVKGFDAAHRACAEESETDWLVTVDADNIVRPEFFDLSLDDDFDVKANCLSWNGLNAMNGLSYGNGGLKLWRKTFLQEMACHEYSADPKKSVDFCWENGYRNMLRTYSDVHVNASPYQAFRVGFREGVKLSLDRGERITAEMMRTLLHPVNLRNLRIWSSVGSHVENGLWAVYGARLAWSQMLNMEWDHSIVKDYDWFDSYWKKISAWYCREDVSYPQEVKLQQLRKLCEDVGEQIQSKTKILIPLLNANESSFFKDAFTYRNE